MKKSIVIIIVLMTIAIIIAVLMWYSGKKNQEQTICQKLSMDTYDIVEDAYINYGNIKYSEYKNIISEFHYKRMYYIHAIDYSKSEKTFFDRNKCDILISYHSIPETVLSSETEAITTYFYEVMYSTDTDNPQYKDGHPYYDKDSYGGGNSTCTVKWKLKDDGVWYIVDFMDPP